MFKIVDVPATFTRTVKVREPSGNGFTESTLIATYRTMPASEVREHDFRDGAGTREFLEKIIVRLDDIADAAGEALDYSAAVRDAVLERPYCVRALMDEYAVAVAGGRQGN